MKESMRKVLAGRLRAVLRASLLFIILAEVAVVHYLHLGHPYFWFENFPGFASLYGFFSCVVIIFASKWLGKLFISRREDYYD
jgi:hypothetical protein